MAQHYTILLVEDSPDDAEIIRYTLDKAEMQYTLTVVDTERLFLEALRNTPPDIVLSDYHLPQFSGRHALEALLSTAPGIPFILVSGAVGDEIAVEMLKTGCVDYVLKDKLTRLPSAIRRAVQEGRTERERLKAIEETKESEQRFRRIADNSPMLIWMSDTEGRTVYVNATWLAFTGRTLQQEMEGDWTTIIHPDDLAFCIQTITDAFQQRKQMTLEYRMRYHDGSYRWVLDTGVPNHLPNGEFIGFIGSALDIQERKQAEESLRESEQKFRTLFDNHSAMKMLLDPETGRIVDANRSASEYYGWSHAELLGMSIFDINISTAEQVKGLMDGVVRKRLKHFIVKHRRRDGSIRDMDIYSNPVVMERRTMLYVIVHDITDKVRSEEQLRLNNAALDSATNTIVLFDRNGSIVWANRAFQTLTGYTLEESIGKNPRELLRSGKQDEKFFRTMWETILNGNVWHGELINRRKDGTEYVEEQTITPLLGGDGDVSHFISIKQDITQRREMEESLRRTTEMLDTFFTQSLDACYFMHFAHPLAWSSTADRDALLKEAFESSAIAKYNDALLKQYHIDPAVLNAMTLKDMFDGDFDKVSRLLTQLFNSGASYYSTSMIRDYDKSEIVVEGNAVCIFDEQRRITGFFGIQRDVTESVKERAELQLNRDRYKKFFEDDMTGDFITKPDGSIVMCNQSFARIFGFSGIAEVLTVNAHSLYADETERMELLQILARDKKVDHYMLRGRRKNGEEFIALMTAIVHTDADGNIIELVGYITDDTRRQEVESQMIQAQKMESIGELASGVAHDFNNILNNILGFSQQLIKYHMDPTRVLRYSDTIGKSAQRGTEIAAKLLSFARQRKSEVSVIAIPDVMSDVVQMCRDTFMHSIEVKTEVDADLWRVQGERSGLYQMLLNISMNARDALLDNAPSAEHPVLVMSAVNRRTVNPDLHWFRNTPPSHCVEIIVRDNGPGIAPQHIDKIFDPFFSTKKLNDKKGSGLGLTVVYNIVKNHHGAILVKSDEGKGTAFHIFLPAVEYSSEPVQGDQNMQFRSRSNELVMVVDDDEGMQILGKELLEDNGYRVLVAASGPEAIALLEQHKEDVALVILDLVMPGMDGGQTYIHMKKIKPDIKAFFCTGYVTDTLISNLLAEEHLTAIQKPFKSNQFLKFVHTMLSK